MPYLNNKIKHEIENRLRHLTQNENLLPVLCFIFFLLRKVAHATNEFGKVLVL